MGSFKHKKLFDFKKLPYKNVDGRSQEGRAVKAFLASRELKARGAHQYKPKDKVELTEEHREFIRNNNS